MRITEYAHSKYHPVMRFLLSPIVRFPVSNRHNPTSIHNGVIRRPRSSSRSTAVPDDTSWFATTPCTQVRFLLETATPETAEAVVREIREGLRLSPVAGGGGGGGGMEDTEETEALVLGAGLGGGGRGRENFAWVACSG